MGAKPKDSSLGLILRNHSASKQDGHEGKGRAVAEQMLSSVLTNAETHFRSGVYKLVRHIAGNIRCMGGHRHCFPRKVG